MDFEYFEVANFECYFGFLKFLLVFEISVFMIFGKRKIVNFCIFQMLVQVSITCVMKFVI